MVTRIRLHVAHNVVGYVALFVALGGTAYAANTVRSEDIVDTTIQSEDVGTGQIKSIDIGNQTIGVSDLAPTARSTLTEAGLTNGQTGVLTTAEAELSAVSLASSRRHLVLAQFNVSTFASGTATCRLIVGTASRTFDFVGPQPVTMAVTHAGSGHARLLCAAGSAANEVRLNRLAAHRHVVALIDSHPVTGRSRRTPRRRAWWRSPSPHPIRPHTRSRTRSARSWR